MKLYSSNCKIEREDQALELIECEDLLNNCEIRWDDDADFIKTFFESHSTMLDDGGTLYAVSVDDLMMLYDRCRGSLRNHMMLVGCFLAILRATNESSLKQCSTHMRRFTR